MDKLSSTAWARHIESKLMDGQEISGDLIKSITKIMESYKNPKFLAPKGRGAFQVSDVMAMKNHGLVVRKVPFLSDAKSEVFVPEKHLLEYSEEQRPKVTDYIRKINNNQSREMRQQERVAAWEYMRKRHPEANMAHIISHEKDGLVSYYPFIQGKKGGRISDETRKALAIAQEEKYPELFDVRQANMITKPGSKDATIIDFEHRALGPDLTAVEPGTRSDILYSRKAQFMKRAE